VDGVKVTIVGVQRRTESGASFLNVQYRVRAGEDAVDHNPRSFIKLISGGQAKTPDWASDAPRHLGPNGQTTEFAIRFPTPPDLGKRVLLLIGENRPVELPVEVTE
jgi:hypothetical protein